MDITLLIESATGLLVLLVILVFIMVFSVKPEKVTKEEHKEKTGLKKQRTDLEYLRSILKKKSSSAQELQEALDLIIKYHGKIHTKLGLRTHPEFDIYMDIIFTICRHPNTNKDIIIKFDIELEKLNPEYISEINSALTRGLNSRGF